MLSFKEFSHAFVEILSTVTNMYLARRAFTLLELIVVIVILGLLAGMTVPTFKNIIYKADDSTIQTNLASLARENIALTALRQDAAFERGVLELTMKDLPKPTEWKLLPEGSDPANRKELTVAFDNGPGSDWASPFFGQRAAIVTKSEKSNHYVGVVYDRGSVTFIDTIDASLKNPADLLLFVNGKTPVVTPPVVNPDEPIDESSAITSMWLWGNPLPPELTWDGVVEERVKNNPETATSDVVAFSKLHDLKSVYFNGSWKGNEHAGLTKYTQETVDALHAEGIKVSLLGGDYEWLKFPNKTGEFVADNLSIADFDRIELNIEPWAGEGEISWEADPKAETDRLIVSIRSAKEAANGIPVDVSLPYWLANMSYDANMSLYEKILAEVDGVAIVAFADRAEGPNGLIARANDAVNQTIASGKPYTIGSETDDPEATHGLANTFYGQDSSVMESELRKVREAFKDKGNYKGVTIQGYIEWTELIAASK